MQNKSCVYWIHLPEHADIFTQGYVGVSSKGVSRRFKAHNVAAENGSNLTVHKAIRKYPNIEVDIVILASPDYCLEFENKLRPSPYIGWNMATGGERSPTEGVTMPRETRDKISKSKVGKPLSQSALIAANKVNSERPSWEHYRADVNVWLRALDAWEFFQENPCTHQRALARHMRVNRGTVSVMFKKIKSGWNPLQDEKWLIFSSELTPDTSGDKSVQSAFCQIKLKEI